LLANYLGVEESWLFEKFEVASPARPAANHGSPQEVKDDIT